MRSEEFSTLNFQVMLEIKNISKSYGAQRVLNSVCEEFGTGRIVGLLGPNGAGKSTLMKIITGYIAADEGEVWIDGKRVAVDDVETKRLVGYLPEHNPLYLDMYVREYLDFVAGVYGLKGIAKKDAVNDVVERTGLTPEQNKLIRQLSKGYRQRVGIAAAIIHNPKVLILDEPTTGLDPNQLIEIRQLIKDLGRDRLVILSTHIMQEVEQVCDDVVVINKGNVVEQGMKDELVAKYGSIENIFHSMRN